MLEKTLIKMSPPSLSKFDIDDGVKLVAIIAMSDFMKDKSSKKLSPIIYKYGECWIFNRWRSH